VLEQFMVLDFVSHRTLQQLPHLPPHKLTTLDTWLAEDLQAYQAASAAAAAGGGGGGGGNASTGLSSGSNLSSSSRGGVEGSRPVTSWAQMCGGWQTADPTSWRMPPSKVIQELITEKRLVWVPHGTATAAADGGAGSSGANAAAAAAAAAPTGFYQWQQGPVAAWLSTCTATKQSRAEELQQKQHPRNQAKLLLNLAAYSSSSSIGTGHGQGPCKGLFTSPAKHGQQQRQGGAFLEFRYHELSHKSSTNVQRHPVLAAHDRLIRVAVDRHRLCLSSSSSGGRISREEQQAALQRGLEDVLGNGVMMAGRRYCR
jgi:hypothetical protein